MDVNMSEKEYTTAIYGLNKYSEQIFSAYNTAIELLNNINSLTVDSSGYDLINVISSLGVAIEISELLYNIEPLKDAYREAYEVGTFLNNQSIITTNELDNVKQSMNELNKIDCDNWKTINKYLRHVAIDFMNNKEIHINIPNVCYMCGYNAKDYSYTPPIILIDNEEYYKCENCGATWKRVDSYE